MDAAGILCSGACIGMAQCAYRLSPIRQYLNLSVSHFVASVRWVFDRPTWVPKDIHTHQLDKSHRNTAIRNMNAQLRKWIACQRSCVLSFYANWSNRQDGEKCVCRIRIVDLRQGICPNPIGNRLTMHAKSKTTNLFHVLGNAYLCYSWFDVRDATERGRKLR